MDIGAILGERQISKIRFCALVCAYARARVYATYSG